MLSNSVPKSALDILKSEIWFTGTIAFYLNGWERKRDIQGDIQIAENWRSDVTDGIVRDVRWFFPPTRAKRPLSELVDQTIYWVSPYDIFAVSYSFATSWISGWGNRNSLVNQSVCAFVWVCGTYIVHHYKGTELNCAPFTCILHHQTALCTMVHKWDLFIYWWVWLWCLRCALLGHPCAPWCRMQVGGAQHRSIVHKVAVYHCSGAQCRSHKPRQTDRQTQSDAYRPPVQLHRWGSKIIKQKENNIILPSERFKSSTWNES